MTTREPQRGIDGTMFSRDELHEYGSIRIRLRKTRFRFGSFEIAGKTVRIGEWTYYDPFLLNDSEQRDFVLYATKGWYELEGHPGPDGWEVHGWVPLSAWRREELRRTGVPTSEWASREDSEDEDESAENGKTGAAAMETESQAAVTETADEKPNRSPGRGQGTGLRVLVRHLRDKEGVRTNSDVLDLLERSDIPWVRVALWSDVSGDVSTKMRWKTARDRVTKAYANGREPHERDCFYCFDGLPARLNELVLDYKAPRNATS